MCWVETSLTWLHYYIISLTDDLIMDPVLTAEPQMHKLEQGHARTIKFSLHSKARKYFFSKIDISVSVADNIVVSTILCQVVGNQFQLSLTHALIVLPRLPLSLTCNTLISKLVYSLQFTVYSLQFTVYS